MSAEIVVPLPEIKEKEALAQVVSQKLIDPKNSIDQEIEKLDWRNDERFINFIGFILWSILYASVCLSARIGNDQTANTNTQIDTRPGPVTHEINPSGYQHVITTGETLASICQRYGVPIEKVMALNAIADANIVFIGQRITIPAS